MTSTHLPRAERRLIQPFHLTLAVIVIVHVAAFYLIFGGGDGEPGGSGTGTPKPSSAHLVAGEAKLSWQSVDSLVAENDRADLLATVPVAPSTPDLITGQEITPAGSDLPTADPEPVPLPATEFPEGGFPSGTVPIKAATVVPDNPTPSIVPIAPTEGTGSGLGDGANPGFDSGSYDLLITKAFHEAWDQPLGVDTPLRDNTAKLAVTIGRDGKVQQFSLAHLTGVPELDSSVLAAARSVRKITPLPEAFQGDTYKVTINFQLD